MCKKKIKTYCLMKMKRMRENFYQNLIKSIKTTKLTLKD